ncbi:hypothetical protein [Candidatus Parabeggiatoa sp. HSG14]|uniref:hypothetical protein n=1 Tax=Candidatus Parabeggiatoa sp. HSG14 TaxID=3055593 RepID=UPI0025A8FA24|nr:hypothetical protein [Thiotrichales bacterium HSG14]
MSKYFQYTKIGLISVSMLFLVNCGGGDSNEGDDDGNTEGGGGYHIKSFSIEGSYPSTTGQIVPINSGVNNGKFTVSWKTTANALYQVRLRLHDNDVLPEEESNLPIIYQNNCNMGNLGQNDVCGSDATRICQFTNDNRVHCGTRKTNITRFLDQIPKMGYMILEICGGGLSYDDCDTKSVEIEFQ